VAAPTPRKLSCRIGIGSASGLSFRRTRPWSRRSSPGETPASGMTSSGPAAPRVDLFGLLLLSLQPRLCQLNGIRADLIRSICQVGKIDACCLRQGTDIIHYNAAGAAPLGQGYDTGARGARREPAGNVEGSDTATRDGRRA